MRTLLSLFSVALFVHLACLASIHASPDSDAIALALDDSLEGSWGVTGSGAVEVEVVADDTAVNGSALKVTIPAYAYGSLIKGAAAGLPGFVSVRYRFDANDLFEVSMVGNRFYGEELGLPEPEAAVGVWNEVTLGVAIGATGNWGFEFNQSEGDRVFYLDGVSVEPGFDISRSGWGVDIEIIPAKDVYQEKEWVELRAVPEESDVAFLYWEVGPSSEEMWSAEWSGVLYDLMELGRLEAVGGRRHDLDGIEVVVPLKDVEATVIEANGGTSGLSVVSGSAGSGSEVFVEVVGPGFLNFEARTSDESESIANRVDGVDTSEGWTQRSRWFPEGSFRHAVSFVGEVDLGAFTFKPGFPISVDFRGEGSVAGLPADGELAYGSRTTLVAQAESGWEFVRWEGNVESESEEVTVSGYSSVDLTAVFARVLSLGDGELRMFGDRPWTVGEGDALMAPGELLAGETNYLEWRLEGPGRFEAQAISNQGNATVYLDGIEQGWILDSEEEGTLQSVAFEVGSGSRVVTLALRGHSHSDEVFDVSVEAWVWEPGLPVSLEIAPGGSVEGLSEGKSRLPYGTVLQLEAKPEVGSHFMGWSGTVDTEETQIELALYRPAELRAGFSQPLDGHSLITAQSGQGNWAVVDGRLHSPDNLEEGEQSSLLGEIEGPTRLRLKLDSESGNFEGIATATIKGGGSVWLSDTFRTLDIPEGTHEIAIAARPDESGAYTPFSLEFEYWVEIAVPHGALTTSPALFQLNYSESVWMGYVGGGEELTFTASAQAGMEFRDWTGALEGKGASDSVVVTGPISSRAVYALESFERGGLEWSVEPAEAAFLNGFIPSAVGIHGDSGEVTFSTQIEGPGTVFATRFLGVKQLETRIDDGDPWDITQMGFIPVEEGAHAIELTVRLEDTAQFSNEIYTFYGLYNLDFASGYPVSGSALGGSVTRAPSESFVLPGTVLTLTAEPHDGNSFLGWTAPLESVESSIELTVEEEVKYEARFAATDDAGGFDWEFEGALPVFIAPNRDGDPGTLRWNLEPAKNAQTVVARTPVEGNVLFEMNFHRSFNPRPGLLRRIYLDGVRIDGVGEASYSELLDEGSHELVVEVEYLSAEDVPVTYAAYIHLPDLRETVRITTQANGAEIEGGMTDETVSVGEELIFVAPETSDSGGRFLGWWKRNGYPHGSDEIFAVTNEISVVASRDLYLIAKYGETLLDFDHLVVEERYGNQWSISEAYTSPDGNASLRAESNGELKITAFEDLVFSWSTRLQGDFNATFEVEDPETGDTILVASGWGDWVYASVYLEQGQSLELSLQRLGGAPPEQTTCLLSDFEVQPGWGPSYVADRRVTFAISEESREVTVAPSHQGAFVGWIGEDRKIISESNPHLETGARTMLRPVFTEAVETVWGSLLPNHAGAWSRRSQDGFPEELPGGLGTVENPFRWRSIIPVAAGPKRNSLTFAMEGPALFSFTVDLPDDGTVLEASINGEDTPVQTASDGETRYIQLPSGQRNLTLSHISEAYSSLRFENFEIQTVADIPLRVLNEEAYFGGVAFPALGEGIYTAGEAIRYAAYPNRGYTFTGWNAPFSAESAVFELIVDMDELPIPNFERIESFALNGRVWQTTEIEAEVIEREYDGVVQEVATLQTLESYQSWIETEIEGPTVLKFSNTDYLDRYTVDGYGLNDERILSRFDGNGNYWLALGDGTHRFRWTYNFEGGPYGDYEFKGNLFEVVPGAMVVVRGSGVPAMAAPASDVARVGDLLEVRAPGADELRGLPDGVEAAADSANVTVCGSMRIDALKWRADEVFSIPVQTAGDVSWSPKSYGIYMAEDLRNRERIYLKVTGLPAGVLEYGFSTGEALGQAFYVNGRRIDSSFRVEQEAYLDGALAVSGPEDEFVWEFTEARLDRNYSSHVRLYELSHTEMKGADYLDYIALQFAKLGLAPRLLDPQGDEDKDGAANYVEFRLGTNPLAMSRFLEIHSLDDGGLALRMQKLDAEGSNAVKLVALVEDEIVDAGPLLEEPVPDSTDVSKLWRRLRELPEKGQTILFFFEYFGEIPSLEDLASE